MPYKTSAELPESVREHLPEHAQEVYRTAYNSAWDEYGDPKKRRGNESQDEAAHKVAWAAVKHEYVKDERTGDWKPKRGATHSGAHRS
jgi:cation transport regulator